MKRRSAHVLLLFTLLTSNVAAQTPAEARARIWQTVLDAATARGIQLPASIGPDDLRWIASDAETENSSLLALSVNVDRLLNQIRFRLRIADRPGAPSFYAWCTLPRDDYSISFASPHRLQRTPSAPGDAFAPVSVRRFATLHLHSENSLATLRVRVLHSGTIGEYIRVRIISNGHTLLARVVGQDSVDASF